MHPRLTRFFAARSKNARAQAPLLFILGPCVIESDKMIRRHAEKIGAIAKELKAELVLKASYDKANRTSGNSFRAAMPPREACQLLAELGKEIGAPVTTDVHTPAEAEMAAEFVDILQIPAFLCRQTDLLAAASKTGRVLNVKKGQFLAPWDVKHIVEKLDQFQARNYIMTERGTTFGYNNLVADMRSLHWMRETGLKVCFDATHSVQRPGGQGEVTGGDGELAPVLARAAVAAGVDAVFIETHENPVKALSDGPNQVPLRQLSAVLDSLIRIHEALGQA